MPRDKSAFEYADCAFLIFQHCCIFVFFFISGNEMPRKYLWLRKDGFNWTKKDGDAHP